MEETGGGIPYHYPPVPYSPRDLNLTVDDLWRAPGLQRVHFAVSGENDLISERSYGTKEKKTCHDIPVAQADFAARSGQNSMPGREQPR